MEHKAQFEQVMGESINMALATSASGAPNVRLVTFAYDTKRPGRVFFCTFKGNQKTKEFAENPKVALMPLPHGAEADLQVRIFGAVQKSDMSLGELTQLIGQKYPEGADTMKAGGDMMEVYEVCFEEAYLTVCMNPAVKVLL